MTTIFNELKVKMAGQYRCVLNAGTPEEKDTGWFDNIITDFGFNYYLGTNPGSAPFNYCAIGTGTSAPAVGNTTIEAFHASVALYNSTGGNIGTPTFQAIVTNEYRFAQGAVVGNMAELTVSRLNNGTDIFSRTRILDSGGSPTTLTVTSIDQLTVFYRLVVTPTLTDTTGTLTLSGTAYNYTARIALADSFFSATAFQFQADNTFGAGNSNAQVACFPAGSTLGSITTGPSGAESGGASGVPVRAAYTAGNFYHDTTWTLDPSSGNSVGGIQCFRIGFGHSGGYYQYRFDTVIPKDNTKTMTFTTRYSWSR